MNWERRYFVSNNDTNKVEFVYREAGKFGFKAGRSLDKSLYSIDDRSYKVVYGSFYINKLQLNIEYCGLNAAPNPAKDDGGSSDNSVRGK